MTIEQSVLELAKSWTDAVQAGDRSRIEGLISDDVIIWRNVTREIQPRADFIELAVNLSSQLPSFHYADAVRFAFDGGFVQQHIVAGAGPSGEPFEAPACIIGWVRDGQICRLDEYYDSAHDPR